MSLKFKCLFLFNLIFIGLQKEILSQLPVDAFKKILYEKHTIFDMDESYLVQSQHVSSVSGIQHTYLVQTYMGVPIFGSVMSVHILKDGKLLDLHNQFFLNPKEHVNSIIPSLSAESALMTMMQSTGNLSPTLPDKISIDTNALKTTIFKKNSEYQDDISLKLIFYPDQNGIIKLGWEGYLHKSIGSDWWHIIIDADNGSVLYKHNLFISCNFDSYGSQTCTNNTHKHHKENNKYKTYTTLNGGSYRVFPLGVESPNHGGRELVIEPADLIASPFGWHDTNGQSGHEFTTTKGNNVEAREDLDGNNNTLGAMADGGSQLVFDFPLNTALPPAQNQNASITNLFYWNNIMHDIWYRYGFTEAAGNFQQNNYGNGGIANDFVRADAMDGSGTNNANFATPVDGNNPRMQMFIWNYNAPFVTATAPQIVAGNYNSPVAGFGPQVFSISGQVILANDGSANPTLACNTLVNSAALNGKIAMVDRGTCEFGVKCLNAQNAGAIAVIVCNNVSDAPITMGAGAVGNQVNIPCVMISQTDCNLLRMQIPGLAVTMAATGNIQFDSDYDNGVIAHEYGHGISIRLTGGAGNSSCLNNQEQMGEGWSDWFGLMLTIKPEHSSETPRGIGTFLINQPETGTGIRRYPYSTDMLTNPMTYDTIKVLVAPHGVGSVWCTMLWELSWILMKEYGYDPDLYSGSGGNNIAMALITEALKLQPCSPGFVTGRNAILQADVALYGGKHQCLIWEAFSKRGLGFNADQGAASNKNDGTQDFSMPPSCCNYVMTTGDDVPNSLRSAVNCASPGDTIRISPNLYEQSILLESDAINLENDINIVIKAGASLNVVSTGEFPVFSIQANTNVLLENLNIVAGNDVDSEGRAIINNGILILKDVDVYDSEGNTGGSVILNNGVTEFKGVSKIK